ncbi:MAG: aldehyde dehydrogenase family protein [Kouleothrix sp.]
MKKVTLELGGKSPSILLPDADLDLATDGVLFGVFFNGGQSCEAGTRCFVPAALHDESVARLVARARSLRLGDPPDLETDMGPIVSDKQCAMSSSISRWAWPKVPKRRLAASAFTCPVGETGARVHRADDLRPCAQ